MVCSNRALHTRTKTFFPYRGVKEYGMSKKYVYLGGPMTGVDPVERERWRKESALFYAPYDIAVLSPSRTQPSISNVVITPGEYSDPLCTDAAIVDQDFNDMRLADLLLYNFIGATKVSIGSCAEIGGHYLADLHSPLIMALDKGNPHDHPFIRRAATIVVPDYRQALKASLRYLLPGAVPLDLD